MNVSTEPTTTPSGIRGQQRRMQKIAHVSEKLAELAMIARVELRSRCALAGMRDDAAAAQRLLRHRHAEHRLEIEQRQRAIEKMPHLRAIAGAMGAHEG